MSDIPLGVPVDNGAGQAKPTVGDLLGPAPAKRTAGEILDAAYEPNAAQMYALSEGGTMTGPIWDKYASEAPAAQVLNAFGQGIKNSWGADPLGIGPETEAGLRQAGLWNDYQDAHRSFWKTLNEVAMRPAALALDLALRRPLRLLMEIPGVEPAMEVAGAFPFGLHGMGAPGAIRAAIPTSLAKARAFSVIGEGEGGWKGTVEPVSPEVTAAVIRALEPSGESVARPISAEPFGPPAEAQPAGPPAEAAPDLHAIARQLAPETFAEYDALSAQRDALSGRLNDWRALRQAGSSPEVAAIDAQIAAAERAGLTTDRLKSERARAAKAIPEGTEPTPEMQALQQRVQETDYQMRDLAPEVSAAYRQAAQGVGSEGMPEGAPTVVPTAPAQTAPPPQTLAPTPLEAAGEPAAPASTPEIARPIPPEAAPAAEAPAAPIVAPAAETAPPAAPQPVAAPSAPEPAPARPVVADIAADVDRQLVAAGRPAEESEAAAALIQAHYEARAARFRGMLGTGAELYSREGATILPGRGAPARAGELELAQARRGAITLRDGQATIRLFAHADASTFIHETGHQWLEELMRDAKDERAPPDLTGDAATVRAWLDVAEGADIPRKAHEKFARGFERYMMEGHAPSPALAGVFAKFKAWLTTIYQTVARLRAPITDDIRGVFDRMLAAPEEAAVIAPEAAPAREFVTEAPRNAGRGGAFEKIPREPLPLTEFLRRLGGVQDQGGEVSHVIGGTRFRPGLINGKGLSLDDAALRAWEEGYFPEHTERPTVSDLVQLIQDEAQGNKRYSAHDDGAVAAYREALQRNAEIDRLGQTLGIDPRQYSRDDFFRLASEHLSLEEQARQIGSQDAAHEFALDELERRGKEWLETRGEAWEPDEVYASVPRSEEDLERGYHEEASASAGAGEGQGMAGNPRPAAADPGSGETGLRPRGPGAGAPGRTGARAGAAPEGGAALLSPADERLVDKAGNIRLDNIDTPDDFKDAIRAAAERQGGFIERRRGVVSDAQREALATVLGTTPDKVLGREIGEAFSDSEIKLLEKTLAQSASHVHELATKAAASGADADIVAMTEAFLRHDMIQGLYSQATAEAGRALRAFRRSQEYWSREAAATADILKQAVTDSTGRTLNQMQSLARKIAQFDQPGQIGKFIRDAQRPGLFDWVQSLFLNALLSGPFTHLGYTAAGEMFGLFRGVGETSAAAMVGAIRRVAGLGEAEGARIGEVPAQLYGQYRGARSGIKAAWQALKENRTVLPAEVERSPNLPGLAGQAVGQGGIIPNPQIGPVTLPVGSVIEAPSRVVAALHSFNWTTFYSQSISGQAFRVAVSKQLEGSAFSARVAELTLNPTEEMIKEASTDAGMGALMVRPGYESFMGRLSRLTNWGVKVPDVPLPGGISFPMGTLRPVKFIDPFVQIQANVMKAAFGRNTPFALFSQSIRDDLSMKNGGVAFDRTAGKLIAGTLFMAAAGGLAIEGIMNHSGPSDPREAMAWRRRNGMPHGLRVGELSFDVLRLGNMGLQMSVAADLAYAAEHIGSDDATKIASELAHAFAQNIIDESFARGPAEMMQAIEDPDRYGARWVRGFLSSAVPFSVGLGQIARQVDPYSRQARTTMDAILAKLPVISEELQPRFDVWGQPVMNRGWAGTYYEHARDDPVEQRLDALGIYPSLPERRIRGVELTDQQYADYSRVAGRTAKMQLDQIIGKPGFAQMPEAAQREIIGKVITTAREYGRTLIMMHNHGIIDSAVAAKKAQAEGASPQKVREMLKEQPAAGSTVH